MKLSPPVVLVGLAVAVLLLVFEPILFIVLLFFGVIYALWFFGRKPCPTCGARGTIGFAGTATVNTEKAYGLVNRTDTSTTQKRDNRGRVMNEQSTRQRQERVPVLRLTRRSTYRCSKCGYSTATDSVIEQEDFSRDESPATNQTVIIEREVAKVPCKYCGSLIDPVRNTTCPKCGARTL
jgi:DNA-directed RNA polymerase subunit M/transcription elongation factor TFIIS